MFQLKLNSLESTVFKIIKDKNWLKSHWERKKERKTKSVIPKTPWTAFALFKLKLKIAVHIETKFFCECTLLKDALLKTYIPSLVIYYPTIPGSISLSVPIPLSWLVGERGLGMRCDDNVALDDARVSGRNDVVMPMSARIK